MGYYNTFVVKIWCDDHGEMVRGHVQHVSSQEYAHFLGLEHMKDFMVSHLYPLLGKPVIQDMAQDELSLLLEIIGDIGQDE